MVPLETTIARRSSSRVCQRRVFSTLSASVQDDSQLASVACATGDGPHPGVGSGLSLGRPFACRSSKGRYVMIKPTLLTVVMGVAAMLVFAPPAAAGGGGHAVCV